MTIMRLLTNQTYEVYFKVDWIRNVVFLHGQEQITDSSIIFLSCYNIPNHLGFIKKATVLIKILLWKNYSLSGFLYKLYNVHYCTVKRFLQMKKQEINVEKHYHWVVGKALTWKSRKRIRKTRDTKTKVMNLVWTYPCKQLAPRREKIPQPFYMNPYSIRPLKWN